MSKKENLNNEKIKKSFDITLVKRLFSYAKKHYFWIIIALVLLIFSIGADLVRPILIGKAIDNFLNGHKKPYIIFNQKVKGAVYFKNKYYLKKSNLNNLTNKKALMVYYNKNYYLINNISNYQVTQINNYDNNKIIIKNNKLNINLDDKIIYGILLKTNDLIKLRKTDFLGILYFSILFLLLLILLFFLQYSQTLILQFAGQKIIYNIRTHIFKHIQSLSFKYFDKNPIGKLVTRVTNDTETLNEMYTTVLINSLKNLFIIIGIIIIMIRINFKLSLISFSIIPVIVLLSFIFRKFARENYRELRKLLANVNSFLSEYIAGMKIVQIFTIEEKVYNFFQKNNKKLNDAYIKEITIFGLFRPSMFFLQILTIGIVLFFGGNNVLKDTLTIGTLFIFIEYIRMFFHPISELAEQFNIFQSAMASAEKIFNIIDTKPAIKYSSKMYKPEKLLGNIEFKNVWFSYNTDDWILKNVNFKINPGESVAFVGATGAGKTSIISLINRYYDIQKGEILIDGYNIKNIDISFLRKNIGQVMQEVFLFTGDIKQNIRLFDDNIDDEKIIKSAKYVNADKFINKLKKKYNHNVAERGATLSAGQRQLISFSRALVFDPSIIIMDEATANIDTETERLIQNAINKIMHDKTTIVIAHRLSTIQHSDKIIVLHKGKVAEVGTHRELLSKKDIYYNLYKLQFKNQK